MASPEMDDSFRNRAGRVAEGSAYQRQWNYFEDIDDAFSCNISGTGV